jgi:hypothetical protein
MFFMYAKEYSDKSNLQTVVSVSWEYHIQPCVLHTSSMALGVFECDHQSGQVNLPSVFRYSSLPVPQGPVSMERVSWQHSSLAFCNISFGPPGTT